MIQVYYNNTDITDSISVNRCYHDMYAGDRPDELHLTFNESKNLWDLWGPAEGDTVRVVYGAIGTGKMFISSAMPKNGTYTITAISAPASGYDPKNKAWQRVRLLQIGREIAERNGLLFHSYGVEDRLYSYILQSGEGDYRFLNRLAQMEGCAVIIYDGKLILYSEPYMEAQNAMEQISIDESGEFEYKDRKSALFGSCTVENGEYSGTFAVANGSTRSYRPTGILNAGGNDEAKRYAKNLLRHANKQCRTGYVRSLILPGYAPGSMVLLSNPRAPSWDGPVFLEHIRNDYGRGQSKIFFRKPLEGY